MAQELSYSKNALTQTQIGDHIHKAMLIEKDIYTMQEAEKSFRASAKELRASKKSVPRPELKRTYDLPKKPKKDKFGVDLWSILIFTVLGALLGGILYVMFGWAIRCRLFSFLMYGGILGLIFGFVITAFIYNDFRKKRKDALESYQKDLRLFTDLNQKAEQHNEQAMQQYQAACAKEEENYRIACNHALVLERQADELHTQLQKMYAIRNRFLSVGIIPPDYRTLDCVCVFDQIFRNDLADTMRQAVTIYEERVFRGEVVRGMGEIVRQLGNLKSSMSELVGIVHKVQTEVSFMSQDLSDIARTQATQQKISQDILKESKATKYAAEAVKRCAEYNTYGYTTD